MFGKPCFAAMLAAAASSSASQPRCIAFRQKYPALCHVTSKSPAGDEGWWITSSKSKHHSRMCYPIPQIFFYKCLGSMFSIWNITPSQATAERDHAIHLFFWRAFQGISCAHKDIQSWWEHSDRSHLDAFVDSGQLWGAVYRGSPGIEWTLESKICSSDVGWFGSFGMFCPYFCE